MEVLDPQAAAVIFFHCSTIRAVAMSAFSAVVSVGSPHFLCLGRSGRGLREDQLRHFVALRRAQLREVFVAEGELARRLGMLRLHVHVPPGHVHR